MTAIIAEIGCEAPDLDEFRRIADAVHDAPGVGWIKWQMFNVDTLVSKRHDPEQYEKLKALQWTPEQHQEAKAHVDAFPGVRPMVSVFSPDMVELAATLKFTDLKLGSGELTDEQTVRAAARYAARNSGWLFVSTGMGTPKEIHRAAGWVAEEGNDGGTIWLACTSAYPCPEQAAHVERVDWLRGFAASREDLVGYSDHTQSSLAGQLAVALGANYIEKHVSGGRGPDADMACSVDEFREWCVDIELARNTLGNRTPSRLNCEMKTYRSSRKSRYAVREIGPGDHLTESGYTYLRPNLGD